MMMLNNYLIYMKYMIIFVFELRSEPKGTQDVHMEYYSSVSEKTNIVHMCEFLASFPRLPHFIFQSDMGRPVKTYHVIDVITVS